MGSSRRELRAISKLKAPEYSVPVLGLIFLRYADTQFVRAEAELAGRIRPSRVGVEWSVVEHVSVIETNVLSCHEVFPYFSSIKDPTLPNC